MTDERLVRNPSPALLLADDRPGVQAPCVDCTVRWLRDDEEGIKHLECFDAWAVQS